MLVDTGASSHVIAGFFARKIGLPLEEKGDVGNDHVGRTIATFRVERPDFAIEGWGKVADGPILVTDVPPMMEKLEIGAFVSPQRLTEEGDSIVLDLLGGEIRAAYFDEAERALGAEGADLGELARVCTDESAVPGLAFVVAGEVDGKGAELLVDTGAPQTDLFEGSPAGRALAGRAVKSPHRVFAAGGRVQTRVLRGAHVTVGHAARVTDVELFPGVSDPHCPRDGALAMDLLRECTLVLGRTTMVGRCQPGSPRPPSLGRGN
jgi:hypothetical protein